MSLFTPMPLTPKQIEQRKKLQAKGRMHFVFCRGVLGWGVSCFIATTLWGWHDKYRWHLPPMHEIWVRDILIGLPIWLLGGYWWGAWMWKKYFPSTVSGDYGSRTGQ